MKPSLLPFPFPPPFLSVTSQWFSVLLIKVLFLRCSLSFTSWCELCLTSCCSFTAVWALFPLLSAFQTSPIISTAPLSAASASWKAGVVTPVWATLNSHISFSLPFNLSFVCLDSTQSQLHCNFPPLQASCKELSVPVWNALLPCLEEAWVLITEAKALICFLGKWLVSPCLCFLRYKVKVDLPF